MGIEQLSSEARQSPFTEEDRIMHTTKMVERTFGRPAADIGTVEMQGDRAVLVIDWGGKKRTLRWTRTGKGAIHWFVDDDPTPLVLGTSGQATGRLADRLGRQQ